MRLARANGSRPPFPGLIELNTGVKREREDVLQSITTEIVVFGLIDADCEAVQNSKQAP